jgi:hypothetical protein
MSLETLFTFTRDGNRLYQNVAIQLDFASDMEMHVPGGMIPFYRYVGFVQQTLDIRQNDYGQDQLNNDPVTGTAKVYQVVSRPESFPDGHIELKLDDQRLVGFS